MVNISAEISQLLYAIYFGVFFGATLHRTNRLIPLAIIHGLINFVSSFPDIIESDLAQAETMDIASEIVSAIVSSVLVIPLLIAGFFILRKITKEDILEKIVLIKK
jgi:membrane protease YdiL (CAAX protease family)